MSYVRRMFLQLRAGWDMSPPDGKNGKRQGAKVLELGRFITGALISLSL